MEDKKEGREPPFLVRKKRREKNASFSHHAQISSKVRSHFVHGPIELKFGGEFRDSFIFNLNGEDRIWSFGKSLERERRREKNVGFSHHAQISSNVRSRFVRGPIELKFEGEVRGSCIFNINGGDRIWSFGQSLERKRRREKNNGFLHHAQISSKVRCCFVHGLIELKFGGEVQKSLILNLNGEDRIWTVKNFLLTLFNHILSIIW